MAPSFRLSLKCFPIYKFTKTLRVLKNLVGRHAPDLFRGRLNWWVRPNPNPHSIPVVYIGPTSAIPEAILWVPTVPKARVGKGIVAVLFQPL
jgi:hypothetical protein